jgi:hypothetical protein
MRLIKLKEGSSITGLISKRLEMKTIIPFIYIFIHINFIYGQEISDIPPFKTVSLNWTHFSEDPNFPEIAKTNITKFGPRWRNKSKEIGDFLYLLENTHSAIPGYPADNDGFLLYKINKYTGETVWLHQHNHHVGVMNFELSSPYIDINKEGNINILTYRDRDTMIKDYKFFRDFVFTPAVHTIDHLTGAKLNYHYGNDTTKFVNTRFYSGSRIHSLGNDKYINLLYKTINENGLTKDLLEIHAINDSLNIGRSPLFTFKIDTDLVTPYDLGYKPWIEQLYNGDTMIILTGTSKPIEDSGNSPEQAFLRWFDISDINNFRQTKVIDVTDAFARPQNNVFQNHPTLHFRDKHVFLTQVMQPNSFFPSVNFSWLCWYDANGNLLGKFPQVTWLDTFYTKVIPIGVKNGNAYLLAQYYKTISDSIETIDILEVKPHTNFAKKVGKFISFNHLNGNFRSFIWDTKFLDNNTVLIENQFIIRKGGVSYSYNFTCNVNEEDLGIETSSTTSEATKRWSYVYPNPTSDFLNFQTDDISSYEVEIRDVAGLLVHRQLFEASQNLQVEMTNFPSGIYHVKINDYKGQLPAMTHKVVKL